jgi:16S rRNA C1402 N4-methylase RsmH
VLTKKVITPSREELRTNPRARSAKLRLFAGGARTQNQASFTSTVTYA